MAVGIGLVTVLSRYLRRTKRSRSSQPGLHADTAPVNRRLRAGIKSPNRGKPGIQDAWDDVKHANLFTDVLSELQSASPVPLRANRLRSASVASDRYSVSEAGDSKSTPQLLGTMGEWRSLRLSLALPPLPLGHSLYQSAPLHNRSWQCAQIAKFFLLSASSRTGAS